MPITHDPGDAPKSGDVLGPYRILGKIGEGGMGQVFRAHDSKLSRDVAIKVLPAALAGDADRLRRLEREARVLAALNHANIAQIFGVLDQPPALVMELVDGDDLSQRLARGPLAADDALAIAIQITHALEAAHEQDIVHRDLKPANIKVRSDGMVKVLDFGLARVFDSRPPPPPEPSGDSLTITSPARQGSGQTVTEMGMVVGTAAYMAPEQARGRTIDKRADIWAFGAVLFEMVTGRSPFGAGTLTETIARVIERQPAWELIPPSLPPHVRDVIRRCLVKDPRYRIRDIGDVRLALETPDTTIVTSVPASLGRRRLVATIAGVAAALIIGIAVGAGVYSRSNSPSVASARRLRLPLAIGSVPHGSDFAAAISPDGTTIAIASAAGVSLRSLTDDRSTELVKDDDVRQVFWSPDSQWVGYATGAAILKVPVNGGSPITLASLRGVPGPFNVISGNVAWFPDDRLVFTTGFSGLMEVATPGANPVELTPVGSATEDFHGAFALPDGRVLISVHDGDFIDRFEVVRGRERIVVFKEAGARLGMPIYASTGHIIFSKLAGGVWAIPFDLAASKTSGVPALVMTGRVSASVSADGEMLIGVPSPPAAAGRLTIMHRDGRVERQVGPTITGQYVLPEWGPGESSVLAPIAEGAAIMGKSSLWMLSTNGTSTTQLTDGVDVARGKWYAGGKRLLVETGSSLCMSGDCYSIGWKAPDQHQITKIVAGAWGDVSPDGTTLMYAGRVAGAEWDLFQLPSNGSGSPQLFQGGAGWQFGARFSPNGRYLAYASTESGRAEIWVAAVTGGGRWRVANDTGYWPQWQADGRALYYVRGTSVVQVNFSSGAPPSFGSPAEVFPSGTLTQMPMLRFPSGFAVSRDGLRFVIVKNPGATASMTIQVLQHWLPTGNGTK